MGQHNNKTEGSYVASAKHRDDRRVAHLVKMVDRLTNIMTADLIVDFGVFLTGCTLIVLELGLVPHRPFEDAHDPAVPPQVRNVRTHTSGGDSGH
jgi:hypothetical protein